MVSLTLNSRVQLIMFPMSQSGPTVPCGTNDSRWQQQLSSLNNGYGLVVWGRRRPRSSPPMGICASYWRRREPYGQRLTIESYGSRDGATSGGDAGGGRVSSSPQQSQGGEQPSPEGRHSGRRGQAVGDTSPQRLSVDTLIERGIGEAQEAVKAGNTARKRREATLRAREYLTLALARSGYGFFEKIFSTEWTSATFLAGRRHSAEGR